MVRFRGCTGNGWTSTFDAHLTGSNGTINVWDIDGAEYVYHARRRRCDLAVADCRPACDAHHGRQLWDLVDQEERYDVLLLGSVPDVELQHFFCHIRRLRRTAGRHHRAQLERLIVVRVHVGRRPRLRPERSIRSSWSTESGMSTTLTFTDVNGHRLLEQLKYPDGSTTVTYGYDSSGKPDHGDAAGPTIRAGPSPPHNLWIRTPG